MDRGIRICFYDLADDQRDAYLAWLDERYLPALLKRPGIVWAAHYLAEKGAPPERLAHTDDGKVPAGGDYILLVGAVDANAFAPPHPQEKFEPVTADEEKMLALRRNERVSIMAEQARAAGPATRGVDVEGTARAIQLGTFNALPEDEDALLAWYARWRMPCMEKLPGLERVRKLVGVSGWAKHGVLYEFSSMAERHAHFPTHERAYPELEAWTDKVVTRLIHAPRSPQLGTRIWPA
jgi:hypothetical protein